MIKYVTILKLFEYIEFIFNINMRASEKNDKKKKNLQFLNSLVIWNPNTHGK